MHVFLCVCVCVCKHMCIHMLYIIACGSQKTDFMNLVLSPTMGGAETTLHAEPSQRLC